MLRTAFTLIEMLIVIVIIGILAAALVPRLQSVQWRARDSKRKVDLRTIYNANEIYILDNGSYAPTNGLLRHSYDTAPWIPWLSGLLNSLPVDPINSLNGGNIHPWMTGSFHYIYHSLYSGTINTYDLATQLENPQDPDRNEIQNWKRNADQHSYDNYWSHPAAMQIYDLSPNVKNQ